MLAGYGIAIPVGAIAVLIVEVGIRCGFRCAAGAGAGAATADLLYAVIAVVGGVGIASVIESFQEPLRYVSAAVLIAIAIYGLRRVRHQAESVALDMPGPSEIFSTYVRFLGLTIINPMTIVYFAAFVVGLGLAADLSPSQGVVFVAGAFVASLSWQTLLAGVGAFAGRRLPPAFQRGAVIGGNLLVLGLAVAILFR